MRFGYLFEAFVANSNKKNNRDKMLECSLFRITSCIPTETLRYYSFYCSDQITTLLNVFASIGRHQDSFCESDVLVDVLGHTSPVFSLLACGLAHNITLPDSVVNILTYTTWPSVRNTFCPLMWLSRSF